MPITDLPTPPSSQDPSNFDTRADAWTAAIQTWTDEVNALAAQFDAPQALRYVFDTATAGDPGSGGLRLGSATQNTSTVIRISETTANSLAVSDLINTWDDATGTTKGVIQISVGGDPTKWLSFTLTSISDAGAYKNLTVAVQASSAANPFTDEDDLYVVFTRAGDEATSVAVGNVTGLGTGVATFLATPSSANFAGALTDETGYSSGALAVFSKNPTFNGTKIIIGTNVDTTSRRLDFENQDNVYRLEFITASGLQRIAMIDGGGVERVAATSAGLAVTGTGIVTTASGSNLTLIKTSGASVDFKEDASLSNALIEATSANRLTFYTNTAADAGVAERMRITENGTILMGTTTDDATNRLQISGGLKVSGGTTTLEAVKTSSGDAASTTGAPVTIASAAAAGKYSVFAYINGQNQATYHAVAEVTSDAGGSGGMRLNNHENGGGMAIDISGTNIRATQTSGGNATIRYVVTLEAI